MPIISISMKLKETACIVILDVINVMVVKLINVQPVIIRILMMG